MKNKRISGDDQGVTQLITGILSTFARKAAAERSTAGIKTGDILDDSEAKNTRIQVGKREV